MLTIKNSVKTRSRLHVPFYAIIERFFVVVLLFFVVVVVLLLVLLLRLLTCEILITKELIFFELLSCGQLTLSILANECLVLLLPVSQ